MRTSVTVDDLKDETHNLAAPRTVLCCLKCGGEYSAHVGNYWQDYWHVPKGRVLKCCRRNLRLMTKRIVYEPVELK